MSSGSDTENEEEPTIAQDVVVTKYKVAGEIVNTVLKKLIEKCVAGAKLHELCEFGDNTINEECGKIYKKDKEMKKGIAFPTCFSVNNCMCHFSPLRSQAEVVLENNDVVKMELGANIDGFAALVAHTLVIGATKENPTTGRRADVVLAANACAEAALRLVKPAGKDTAVAETLQKVTKAYECTAAEGITSFQLLQHEIEGEKSIVLNPTDAQRKDHKKCEFEQHEVYAIDVIVSTGEGKPKKEDTRTTVFRHRQGIYQLKMKASRQFFAEVESKYGNMAFSLRGFEDEKKARVGVLECVKHDLLVPYDVLYEKEGEFVAQFKYTVLLMPNGPMRITGLPNFPTECYKSEKTIEDAEVKAILSQPISTKSAGQKKKAKKNKKTGDGENGAAKVSEPAVVG